MIYGLEMSGFGFPDVRLKKWLLIVFSRSISENRVVLGFISAHFNVDYVVIIDGFHSDFIKL